MLIANPITDVERIANAKAHVASSVNELEQAIEAVKAVEGEHRLYLQREAIYLLDDVDDLKVLVAQLGDMEGQP